MKYYYDNVTDITMASVKFSQNNEIISKIVQEDGKYVVYIGEEEHEEDAIVETPSSAEVVETKPKRKYNKKDKKDSE